MEYLKTDRIQHKVFSYLLSDLGFLFFLSLIIIVLPFVLLYIIISSIRMYDSYTVFIMYSVSFPLLLVCVYIVGRTREYRKPLRRGVRCEVTYDDKGIFFEYPEKLNPVEHPYNIGSDNFYYSGLSNFKETSHFLVLEVSNSANLMEYTHSIILPKFMINDMSEMERLMVTSSI